MSGARSRTNSETVRVQTFSGGRVMGPPRSGARWRRLGDRASAKTLHRASAVMELPPPRDQTGPGVRRTPRRREGARSRNPPEAQLRTLEYIKGSGILHLYIKPG